MRRLILPITLAALSACQPPVVTQAPAAAVGHARAAALPEPGVYVLQRVRGMALPAALKPPGRYTFFERVLAGRLYLMPDGTYVTIICSDVVDSAGRVANPGYGGQQGWYRAAGGRVYFSNLIVDGPADSIAVRVHGDTVEFAPNVFLRDRTSALPRYPLSEYVYFCPAVHASPTRGARPTPSRDALFVDVFTRKPEARVRVY